MSKIMIQKNLGDCITRYVQTGICTRFGRLEYVSEHPDKDGYVLVTSRITDEDDWDTKTLVKDEYLEKVALCLWEDRDEYYKTEFERWDVLNENIIALCRTRADVWCVYEDGYDKPEYHDDGTRRYGLSLIGDISEDVYPVGVFPTCAPIGKVFYRPSEPKKYYNGTIIRIHGVSGEDYMLACVGERLYSLIGLKTGNRWTELMEVESGNTRTLTKSHINEMVGDDYTWEVVEV